jgi:hypothetical protein
LLLALLEAMGGGKKFGLVGVGAGRVGFVGVVFGFVFGFVFGILFFLVGWVVVVVVVVVWLCFYFIFDDDLIRIAT